MIFHAFFYFIPGTFTGPQIRKLIENEEFTYSLDLHESDAWGALKDVIANYLGKKRADNYKQIVARLIETYRVMGVHMSLKIHFLANHLDFFPDNLGNSSQIYTQEKFITSLLTLYLIFQAISVTNMGSDSTKRFHTWRKDIKAKELQNLCLEHI